MAHKFSLLSILILLVGCHQNTPRQEQGIAQHDTPGRVFFSNSVQDSFSILVSLPNEYDAKSAARYPVVYLLDANLYFDILAVTLRKYSEVGLSPAVILVGIGYKDFPSMDSLRNRDYTYPVAIPEYEMSTSGGAGRFLKFINEELIPSIDKEYLTDTLKRVLAGHSLGGYFTTFALLQNLLGRNNNFSYFIAASPSLHYNNYYLLNEFRNVPELSKSVRKIRAYIGSGGLEHESGPDTSMVKLRQLLSERQSGYIEYKSDDFSNLGHMETQMPTFLKGLNWTLNNQH